MRLAGAGETGVNRARAIRAETLDVVACVRESGKPPSGALHRGAIPTIAFIVLPQTMTALKAHGADLRLHLHQDQTARDRIAGHHARPPAATDSDGFAAV